MSTAAIVMMLIAIVTVWGGLVASLLHLSRHPEGSVTERDDHGDPVPAETV